jgi:hypothetical protein
MVAARRRDRPTGEQVAWPAHSGPVGRRRATTLGHEAFALEISISDRSTEPPTARKPVGSAILIRRSFGADAGAIRGVDAGRDLDERNGPHDPFKPHDRS